MPDKEQTEKDGAQSGVEIIIDISPDSTEVFVSFKAKSESSHVNTQEIRDALSAKGISRMKDEAIEKLQGDVDFGKRILVAEGVKPQDGEDSKLVYSVAEDKPVRVKAGDEIARIEPPGKGVNGVTIFGKPVEARKGKDFVLPEMVNIVWNKDDPLKLYAEVDGYFSIINNVPTVKAFFELEISEDAMKAWVTIPKPDENNGVEKGDLVDFLKQKKIEFGVKEDELDRIFNEKLYDKKILIAQGKPVEHGKDGQLRHFFDITIEPKLDEKGNVDHKELNLIQSVKKGDRLVEVLPPTKGEEGKTVTNEAIPANPGKEIARPSGNNASPDPSNPAVLIADIDGQVVRKGNAIEVTPLLIIKNDVDYSTGNIDFIGSVFINGDVKAGFSVKAKLDVEVNGYVEDAFIEAGGDVMLKTGFGGKGDGKIIAHGKIVAKFCENQTILCDNDMIFCEYLMHCHVETKGKLLVTESKGLIVGGEVYADKGFEAKIVGNKNYVPTKIFICHNKNLLEQRSEKEADLNKAKNDRKKIEKARQLLKSRKILKKSLTNEQTSLQEKLDKVNRRLGLLIEKYEAEINELQKEMSFDKNVPVKIHEAVYPRTMITIFDGHYEVQEALKEVSFRYTDSGVEAVDMSEEENGSVSKKKSGSPGKEEKKEPEENKQEKK
ncbi:flagellar assembly protein A [candidate division KSB1 bacterium]